MATFKANKTFYRTEDGKVMAEGDPAFDHGQLIVREGLEIEDTDLAIWPDGPDLLKQMKALNTEAKAQAEAENKAVEGPPENKSAARSRAQE